MLKLGEVGSWDRAFMYCPGAWYGNQPVNGVDGNVTVDAAHVVAAVKHLKRYFRIVSTSASRHDGGVLFVVAWKCSDKGGA